MPPICERDQHDGMVETNSPAVLLGRALRSIREDAGFTGAEMAVAVGLATTYQLAKGGDSTSRSTISHWEAGRRIPPYQFLAKYSGHKIGRAHV